jgi:hypothetical protein
MTRRIFSRGLGVLRQEFWPIKRFERSEAVEQLERFELKSSGEAL